MIIISGNIHVIGLAWILYQVHCVFSVLVHMEASEVAFLIFLTGFVYLLGLE